MATTSLFQRIIVEQVRRSLLSLTPAERMVLFVRFGLGDTLGLAGAQRIHELPASTRDGIEKSALRRLRRLARPVVEVRKETPGMGGQGEDASRVWDWRQYGERHDRLPPDSPPSGRGGDAPEVLWDEA